MSSQYLFLSFTRSRCDLEFLTKFFYIKEYFVINTNNLYPLNQAISKSKYILFFVIVNTCRLRWLGGINAIASKISQLSFCYSSVAKVSPSSSILLKPLAGKELLEIIPNLLKEPE